MKRLTRIVYGPMYCWGFSLALSHWIVLETSRLKTAGGRWKIVPRRAPQLLSEAIYLIRLFIGLKFSLLLDG